MSLLQQKIDELQTEMSKRLQGLHAAAEQLAETERLAEALKAIRVDCSPICTSYHTGSAIAWVSVYGDKAATISRTLRNAGFRICGRFPALDHLQAYSLEGWRAPITFNTHEPAKAIRTAVERHFQMEAA